MKRRLAGFVRATLIRMACMAMLTPAVLAQPATASSAVIPGERVSDWLLRNAAAGADMTALHWQVQAERLAQGRLREAVLQSLYGDARVGLGAEARAQLADWLRGLPLTGRLTLAIGDARWLQGAPSQDPVLGPGHSMLLLPRPRAVTVVTQDGRPCLVSHRPAALARDYLQACLGDASAARVDRVWVAQPDGRTASYGIAPWTLEAQDDPGPGAWIWAPQRGAMPDSVSDNLARFLATQLPGESMVPTGPTSVRVVPRAPSAPPPRSAQLTASDWGEIGVLQTPSARMAPAGAMRLHLNRAAPYTRGTVMLQPLDWLEAGFRYSEIDNRLSNAAVGNQARKDKSIDFKLRLREETAFWPQLALGVRDLGGTGLFSGEYLVASKRWGNWDASIGLGWGYLGSRGNVKNPFSVFGDRFDTRPVNNTITGGTANLNAMFRGPTALFAGLQWHSPYDPLVLKFELDGNDYQNEPLGNRFRTSSPFNVGAVYRYSPNLDFSVALQRGNRLSLGLTLHGGLDNLHSPKLLDPAPLTVRAQAPEQLAPQGWENAAEAIELYTGWAVREIRHQHVTTTVRAETDGAIHLQERIERAIKVLHRDAPASTTRFVLQLQDRGLPMSQVVVDRAEWVALNTRADPPALRLPAQESLPGDAIVLSAPQADTPASGYWRGKVPGFRAAWGPSYSQILGGPDSFLLYQLGVQAWLEQRLSDTTWISGGFNLRLLDNYDKFTFVAPSKLPRVRTFQREYATSSRLTMPVLQLTHVGALGGGHYGSVYGGMLEFMYGGVGAEWLYRPWKGRIAWGVDVNHVRQRDFRQNLGFRDYSVNTGHATLYWDTGWNDVQVNLSVGRYLAGDVGATLEVKRSFRNGVAMGAWATKTNVSAAQFGEGSFDKGIYVTVPFDVLLPQSSPGAGSVVWNPLTRDGGARLGRQFPLYELTRQRDRRALQWRAAIPSVRSSAEDTGFIVSEPDAGLLESTGPSARLLGHQIADVPASTWLLAGGAVLASSLLDKSVDRWAVRHPGGNAKRLGDGANAVPYALALGAGLLYTGIGGGPASDTAETAIKAAAFTIGTSFATRFALGRARPYEGQGNRSFAGPGSGSFKSGFPSTHTAAAFALVTPFAQQYDMPWLYGVAAATAFGRVQKREHWLSDTVAGAFLGYAIGSMLSDQQMGRSGMRLSVTPHSVVAHWEFD